MQVKSPFYNTGMGLVYLLKSGSPQKNQCDTVLLFEFYLSFQKQAMSLHSFIEVSILQVTAVGVNKLSFNDQCTYGQGLNATITLASQPAANHSLSFIITLAMFTLGRGLFVGKLGPNLPLVPQKSTLSYIMGKGNLEDYLPTQTE